MKNASHILQVQENRTRLPVCFLHNRKLKAKCAKERAQNKRMYVYASVGMCVRTSVFAYMYVCTYIMRLCQMADARRRSKARRRVRPSVRLSLLPAACRPCPVTSHFSFLHSSSFVVVLQQPTVSCKALSHTNARLLLTYECMFV